MASSSLASILSVIILGYLLPTVIALGLHIQIYPSSYIKWRARYTTMRIGSTQGPLGRLEPDIHSTTETFLKAIKAHTAAHSRQVMLGDATVTTQNTFDAMRVSRMFAEVVSRLSGWDPGKVTITNNEDIRRIFVKFTTSIGDYTITGHFSLQFHVLLYYMPDQRVIDCQKELSEVIDSAKSGEEQLANDSDSAIAASVNAHGAANISDIELFERLYNDDDLMRDLEEKIDDAAGAELRQLADKKKRLFAELDALLTETYQTTPVLIDDARLVTGEEGCLCTFDVERESAGRRLAIPDEIEHHILDAMAERICEVQQKLEQYGCTTT